MLENRRRSVLSVVGILLLIAVARSAGAEPRFLGLHWSVDILYDVDIATGSATHPRPISTGSLVGLAMSPDGTLYSLTSFGGAVPNSLFVIDPESGAAQLVGATGLANIFEGDLDFNPGDGLLYAVQNVPSATVRDLFLINPATGSAAAVGSISDDGDLSAMAFDSAGTLFVLDVEQGLLLTVDVATAAILTSMPLSGTLGGAAGMDFDPNTQTLYVADGGTGGTDMLYTLDTANGNLTVVGPTGLANGLAGLAFDLRAIFTDGFESGDTSAW